MDLTKRRWTVSPPWRSIPADSWARLKHRFGTHTYHLTLRPQFDNEGMLEAVNMVSECWVCDARQP